MLAYLPNLIRQKSAIKLSLYGAFLFYVSYNIILPMSEPALSSPLKSTSGRFSFPKTSRLLNEAEFKAVFSDPVRSFDNLFTVLARPNQLGIARLGLAVSKKALRFAHQRNLAKRIIRESFRRQQSNLVGLDIVVMAKFKATDHDNPLLHASMAQHWIRILKRCKQS